MKLSVVLAGFALATSAVSAHAAVITFGSTTFPEAFSGTVTEDGYTYSTASGSLYTNWYGNPGEDMEGESGAYGGTLDIVRAKSGGSFFFDSVDFAAYSVNGFGNQFIVANGYDKGSLVESVTFTLGNTDTYFPSYSNWTTETNPNSVLIDDLQIVLPASGISDTDSVHFDDFSVSEYTAIDNVVLSSPGVPEPATWAMLILGMGGVGATLRGRRQRFSIA